MKILFVNDYSENVGGTETYLNALIHQFKRDGHTIVTYYGSDNFKASYSKRKNFGSYLKRIFSFEHYLAFRKKISAEQPDLIHIHNIYNEVSPSILAATAGIPAIMTLHDNSIVQAVFNVDEQTERECQREICPGCRACVGFKGMVYEKVKRFIHSFLYQKVSTFIAPSMYMKEIIEQNSNFKVKQMYNGFELDKPELPHLKNKALFAGRLTADKGIDYLIEALPQVLAEFPDFELTVVGTGDLESNLLRRVEELGITKSATFLGHLDKDAVSHQYKKNSFVIVPSTTPDNLPTVCIEALSVGRPVVAANVGGIPEIVLDNINGLLIHPKNPSEISNAVIMLLRNKDLLKKLSNTASGTLDKFRIQNHATELLRVYQSLHGTKK